MRKEVRVNACIKSIAEYRYEDMVCDYYRNGNKHLIFLNEDGKYIGTVELDELAHYAVDEDEMLFYILNSDNRVDTANMARLTRAVEKGEDSVNIVISTYFSEGTEIVTDTYNKIYQLLKDKNIWVSQVIIPTLSSLPGAKEHTNFCLARRACYSEEMADYVKPIIDKISPISYDELRVKYLAEEHIPLKRSWGEESLVQRIFLVGPCVANEGASLESDALPAMLYRKLKRKNLEIKTVRVEARRQNPEGIEELLQYNLTTRDMVFLIEDSSILKKRSDTDIEMQSIYESYDGDKYLYFDIVIHPTVFGQELICQEMLKKIIPWYEQCQNTKYEVLRPASPLEIEARNHQAIQAKMQDYLERVKKEIKTKGASGAIVMNANPFTKGHRYLVEYGLTQVKQLIVFVVEEDSSYVPFQERLQLVRQGVADLENVYVVPSGEFIISKTTFHGYFEKEEQQEAVIDASVDIDFFGTYIAPAFQIVKRFVGEEPTDLITRQYNEQMKESLQSYGIELVEIPRVQRQDGKQVISASQVRKLLEADRWQELETLVPQPTLQYLKKNQAFLAKRKRCMKQRKEQIIEAFTEPQNMREILECITRNPLSIIYGTGVDALRILQEVPVEDMDKLLFCDKKASRGEYEFFGRLVIAPESMVLNYSEVKIIISSRRYTREIFCELLGRGFKQKNILWLK